MMKTKPIVFKVYRDARKQWRWRASRSGHVIFCASESYTRRFDCVKILKRVTDAMLHGRFFIAE